VDESHLAKLTLADPVVQGAIRSYQTWFIDDLNSGCQRYHRKPATADGLIGPATADVLQLPRCGMPDFARPGEPLPASFPDSCRNQITTSYRMSLSGLSDSQLKALWVEADQNWADVIDVGFEPRLDDYPNTNIHSSEASLGGSILADQFLSQGRCGDRLRGRFDNRVWAILLFLATCTHEHGHALGVGHSNDSLATMYAMITQASMARRGKPNSSDIAMMLRQGYKRRTSPPPPPPPEGDDLLIIGGKKAELFSLNDEDEPPEGLFLVHFSSGTNRDWLGNLE
jgi:hypothetical protein